MSVVRIPTPTQNHSTAIVQMPQMSNLRFRFCFSRLFPVLLLLLSTALCLSSSSQHDNSRSQRGLFTASLMHLTSQGSQSGRVLRCLLRHNSCFKAFFSARYRKNQFPLDRGRNKKSSSSTLALTDEICLRIRASLPLIRFLSLLVTPQIKTRHENSTWRRQFPLLRFIAFSRRR